jgi:hypothetical protein
MKKVLGLAARILPWNPIQTVFAFYILPWRIKMKLLLKLFCKRNRAKGILIFALSVSLPKFHFQDKH